MEVLLFIAVALSLASLATSIVYAYKVRKYVSTLLDELSLSLLTRRKSKRVKRYVLLKFVCNDKTDLKSFVNGLEKTVARFLGELDKIDCSITVASVSTASRRAIIRVAGDYRCVKRVLVALSIQHILFDGCIVVPLRTSGLLSRLRKML
ncbi:MAG: Rpp14/Pop5 family protein [Ignisphaera sp.]